MKNLRFLKAILVLHFLVIVTFDSNGQVPAIYTVDEINQDSCAIGSYNYETQEYEELFILSPPMDFFFQDFTFDPFRKIIYYIREISNCSGYLRTEVYSIDIPHKSRSLRYETEENLSILDVQYDFFSNSLMLRGWDSIRFYSVDENKRLNTLATQTCDSVIYFSNPNSYNINTRDYLYYYDINDDPNIYRTYINIDSNSFATKVYENIYMPVYLTANLVTNTFFGVEHKNDSSFIVSINPITGLTEKLHVMPKSYACYSDYPNFTLFDNLNSRFIIPYTNSDYDKLLAIYDVKLDSIYSIPSRFYHSAPFMDYSPEPLLKFINDTFVASVSNNYIWYINDTLISNANGRKLKPLKSGFYKFSTLNYMNDTLYSNELYYETPNSTNTQLNDPKLLIYPIPVKDQLNIKLRIPSSKYCIFTIFDVKGNLIHSFNHKFDTECQINISSFTDGLYIIKCEIEGKYFFEKFIKNSNF